MKFRVNWAVWLMMGSLFMSPVALAAYDTELFYTLESTDYDDQTERTDGTFVYTQHLGGVNTQNKPLAEAPYLHRSRQLDLSAFGAEIEYSNGEDYLIGGGEAAYTHRKLASSLILGASYGYARHKYRTAGGSTIYNVDVTGLELKAGWYLEYAMSATVSLVKTDYDFSTNSRRDYETTDLIVDIKKIMKPKSNNAINLEGRVGLLEYGADKKENTGLRAIADYYLNRSMSLGIMYEKEFGDEIEYEGTTTALRGRFFITRQLSLRFEFESFSADDNRVADYDQKEVGVAYRF